MEPSGAAPSRTQAGQDDSVLGEVLVNQRSLRQGPEVRPPAPRQQRLLASSLRQLGAVGNSHGCDVAFPTSLTSRATG